MTKHKQRPQKPRCPHTGKIKHPTHTSAIAAAIRLSKHRGHPLRTYHCPHCKTFHLTKKLLSHETIDTKKVTP